MRTAILVALCSLLSACGCDPDKPSNGTYIVTDEQGNRYAMQSVEYSCIVRVRKIKK